jgi:hypothetical protein
MYLPNYVIAIHTVLTSDLDAAAPGDEIPTEQAEWDEEDGWQPVFIIIPAE